MSSAADYWVGPTIGEGAFGHVVYGIHKSTERKVAIKVMEVSRTSHTVRNHYQQQQIQAKTDMILNERRILSLPDLKASKWVVDLWAAFCDNDSGGSSSMCLYFVMELATGGDLQALIQRGLSSSSSQHSWCNDSVPHYAMQLIVAVNFLHSKGILHCDLKPENVILEATSGNLKLADFGCALNTKDPRGETHSFPRGTAQYSAPEILRAESPSKFTTAVDYWSMGCILHAMLEGRSPFDRGSESLTVEAVFDHVARNGVQEAVRNTSAEDFGATARSNTRDGSSSEGVDGDPCVIDEAPSNRTTGIEANTTENDDVDQYSLRRMSAGLLAVVPEDRISFWEVNANLFVDSKLQNGGVRDDSDPGLNIFPPAGSELANIMLPLPDWQDEVESTTLRDGSLGWVVFQTQ